ncbi:MAG: pilin [Patescibacteria group bacterium]
MFKKNIFFAIFLGLFLINISSAFGQGILPEATGDITVVKDNETEEVVWSNCPSGDRNDCGLYTVNDFVSLAINVSKWILGIVGSLSLVMFIYGGFMFLISAGSSDSISKAKKIIIAAVVGLIIVFSSYLIIKFVLSSIGLNWNGEVEQPAKVSAETVVKTLA